MGKELYLIFYKEILYSIRQIPSLSLVLYGIMKFYILFLCVEI
jgi:hypothetical protein